MPQSRPAPRCCTSHACGPSTTRPITARLCATRTATTSRRSATFPKAASSSAGAPRLRLPDLVRIVGQALARTGERTELGDRGVPVSDQPRVTPGRRVTIVLRRQLELQLLVALICDRDAEVAELVELGPAQSLHVLDLRAGRVEAERARLARPRCDPLRRRQRELGCRVPLPRIGGLEAHGKTVATERARRERGADRSGVDHRL